MWWHFWALWIETSGALMAIITPLFSLPNSHACMSLESQTVQPLHLILFSYLNTEGSYIVSCFLLRSIRKIWLPKVSPAESCWDKEELLATRNITFILPTLYSDPDDESSSLFKRILGIAGADLWTIALKLVGNCSRSFSELSRPPPSVALLF